MPVTTPPTSVEKAKVLEIDAKTGKESLRQDALKKLEATQARELAALGITKYYKSLIRRVLQSAGKGYRLTPKLNKAMLDSYVRENLPQESKGKGSVETTDPQSMLEAYFNDNYDRLVGRVIKNFGGDYRLNGRAEDIVQNTYLRVAQWQETGNRIFLGEKELHAFVNRALYSATVDFLRKAHFSHEFPADNPGKGVDAGEIKDHRLFNIPLSAEDSLIFEQMKDYFLKEGKLNGKTAEENMFPRRSKTQKASMEILRDELLQSSDDEAERVKTLKEKGLYPFTDCDLEDSNDMRGARNRSYKMKERVMKRFKDELQRLDDETLKVDSHGKKL